MAGIKWWTEERVAFVRRLAVRGLQSPEIARRVSRRFGRRVTADAVAKICGERGIRRRRGRPPKKEACL